VLKSHETREPVTGPINNNLDDYVACMEPLVEAGSMLAANRTYQYISVAQDVS
jgi:hypothetical protein